MADDASRSGDRDFIRRVLILLAILGVAALLIKLSDLLILIFGAVVIAVLLSAITNPIHRHLKIGRGFSLMIAVALVLGVIGGAGALFGREMAVQVRELGERLPGAWQSAREQAGEYGIEIPDFGEDAPGEPAAPAENGAGAGGEAADGNAAPAEEAAGEEQQGNPGGGILSEIDPSIFGQVGGILMTIFGGIAHTLLVVVGGIYLAAQPDLYRKGLLKLIPKGSRGLAAEGLDDSGKALKLWLLGTLVSMVLVGSLTAFGLWLIGVPSWLALGLLAGLFEFIPILGPIAAAIPGVLLALTVGLDTALWAVGLYLLIQQLEGNVIQPIVQRYAVDLPPAMLLFTLVAGGLLFGIVGIIFAAPLTVVAYVLVKRLYVREALDTETPLPHERHD
ncbi:MAG: AI-2E family transporter [Allosphingosinicella sp.]|uniref:AI-2E family transporter n=1 Tax=Allosphingosinicella sp. TaxID=2823234 RepID=UPI003935E0DD